MITINVLNVGQGNMVVVVFEDNTTMVYDCNITQENKGKVFAYLRKVMPKNCIDLFINSHRDADHMRGINILNTHYPIDTLWDSGVSANTDTPEYKSYMSFRRTVSNLETVKGDSHWKEKPAVTILSGQGAGTDSNSQSIVLLIKNGASMLLAGDTDGAVWKNYIVPTFDTVLKSDVLLASHHGSKTFFEAYDGYGDYIEHLELIRPQCVMISVGPNPHGHPDSEALDYYDSFSTGLKDGTKLLRTDEKENLRVTLYDNNTFDVSWEHL